MVGVTGYEIAEKIHESTNSLVFRGRRMSDHLPVVLKVLKAEHPTMSEQTRFHQEYEITRRLNRPGIVKAHAFEHYDHAPVIILEDFGGESLVKLMARQPFGLTQGLEIAVQIAEALGEIHAEHIIHKDINPSNIVYNPATRVLKIVDFGIATALPRENPTAQRPEHLEGTLPYLAPEQSGRMNRSLDYRADFYSLGITLYELFTGQLPFAGRDSLELIHCHIARQPEPPVALRPDLPQPVSDIILKLMAKTAEERYQSARGLADDLRRCLETWRHYQRISPFPLGQTDFSEHFHIPEKLYGRSDEIKTLLATFEQASRGPGELLLVQGYSGIGKSSLVASCHKPITEKQGYFIAGKYDQYRRNIPYSAVVAAFRELVQQILTETEDSLCRWRARLLRALGPNGQVIVEVMPEIELIIGPQPEIPKLGPAEAQNRFELVIQNFIRAFCDVEHPLLIFLDDLQWADSGSLKLLKLMLTGTHHLLLIGAFRDNEVSHAHPLLLTIEEIRQMGVRVSDIVLAPLAPEEIVQLVADSVHCPADEAAELARLVNAKTQGNPFFIKEFLRSLHADGLLCFDRARRRWTWDMAKVLAQDITDNVVALMAGRVARLPPWTQTVLRLAACIGNQFDLKTLAIVSQTAPRRIMEGLWEAMVDGMILTLGDAYKQVSLDVTGFADYHKVRWKFAHDRIQQAAYSQIPEEKRARVHWTVGRLLLENTPAESLDQQLFAIVDHLNQGREARGQGADGIDLVTLNLQAGTRSKNSAAYGPAAAYLQTAIELLPADAWRARYALTLALHGEAAETAYLRGDFEQMDRLCDAILQNANSLLDQMRAYEIRVVAFMSRHQQREAIRTALAYLRQLGIRFPAEPGLPHFLIGLTKTRLALVGRRIEDLEHLPQLTDPRRLAVMRIMVSIWPAAYQALPNLMPLLAFRLVGQSLAHGNCEYSVIGYALYGLVLCGKVGDIEAGYRFGQLALRLCERFHHKSLRARVLFVMNCFVKHWKEPAHATVEPAAEAYQMALETGSLEFAGYLGVVSSYHPLLCGVNLHELKPRIAAYTDSLHDIRQENSWYYNKSFHQGLLNLLGESEDPCRLDGAVCLEDETLPKSLGANDRTGLFFFYFQKMLLAYLFARYGEAVEYAAESEKYADGVAALLAMPVGCFYAGLARIACSETADPARRHRLLHEAERSRRRLQRWARHAPDNFRHRLHLLEAERARVLDRAGAARDGYDQAIRYALEHRYPHEAALACELAGRYYLEREHTHLARHYLQEAWFHYHSWGAEAKLTDMKRRYPEWMFVAQGHPATPRYPQDTQITSQSHHSSMEGSLDLQAMVKASQAISDSIVLDRLIENLMKVVLQHAGADQGWLLLHKDGQWSLEAHASDSGRQIRLQSTPLMEVDPEQPIVPVEMLQYVIRTRQRAVANNPHQAGMFTRSLYFSRWQPKSVLCNPIMYRGVLRGALYLENNLVEQAFTPQRQDLLDMLSAQIAISIENALAYAQLEQVHQAEQARIAAEAANRAKSDFLAHMSHELRTPLNGILGYAQLLQRERELSPFQRNGVDVIHRCGEHLLALINDILDLSKIEAGKLELAPSEFNFRSFLRNIIELFDLRAREKGLVFQARLDEGLPRGVCADERRLRQIIFNLLSNAVKFTDKGRVLMDVHRCPDTHRIEFVVEDEGIGIPAEELERIFQPFHQVKHAAQTTEGTGLGLPITKSLIEAMGGRLEARSRVGEGSRFSFHLTLTEVHAAIDDPMAQAPERLASGYRGPPYRILVVDDKAHNREVLYNLCRSWGFHVDQAPDGKAGLERAESFRPHLILLDLVMPGMDGFECTRRLRAHPELGKTIIIAVSASVYDSQRLAGRDAGCDDFVPKPVDARKLQEVLGNHLQLEWIYEEEHPKTPNHEAAAVPIALNPPNESVTQLLDLARLGDIAGVIRCAESLAANQPELESFAAEVTRLAGNFDEKKLRGYLETFRGN